MKKQIFKSVIERVFARAGDLLETVSLVRTTTIAHVPGDDPTTSEQVFTARLFSLPPRRSRSSMEVGPVLDKAAQLALLLCEESAPISGDVLRRNDQDYVISQVANMDHDAGLLFEVWFQ